MLGLLLRAIRMIGNQVIRSTLLMVSVWALKLGSFRMPHNTCCSMLRPGAPTAGRWDQHHAFCPSGPAPDRLTSPAHRDDPNSSLPAAAVARPTSSGCCCSRRPPTRRLVWHRASMQRSLARLREAREARRPARARANRLQVSRAQACCSGVAELFGDSC